MQHNSLGAKGIKNKVVIIPAPKSLICKCDGFKKKELASYKIDLIKECGYNCTYCTSPFGMDMKFRKNSIQKAIDEQYPGKDYTIHTPGITIEYYNLISSLDNQLRKMNKSFGAGEVLMFSQLTDAFSSRLVNQGYTKVALDLILNHTSFRIRVLTKNAIIGDDDWIEYFEKYRDRFIVGLSIGTTDDRWALKVERGTSSPSDRLKALHNLQNAGISTFGMLCPIFPDVVQLNKVGELIDKINPDIVENIWAEPFNSHTAGIWKGVRSGFRKDSEQYKWLTQAYENGDTKLITQYHSDLYSQLLNHAIENEWTHKFIYLLYEKYITHDHIDTFRGLVGVNSQSNKNDSGLSNNEVIAELQKEVE